MEYVIIIILLYLIYYFIINFLRKRLIKYYQSNLENLFNSDSVNNKVKRKKELIKEFNPISECKIENLDSDILHFVNDNKKFKQILLTALKKNKDNFSNSFKIYNLAKKYIYYGNNYLFDCKKEYLDACNNIEIEINKISRDSI